ncbi:hypothetical protein D3C72_780800 [compost metagenome]
MRARQPACPRRVTALRRDVASRPHAPATHQRGASDAPGFALLWPIARQPAGLPLARRPPSHSSKRLTIVQYTDSGDRHSAGVFRIFRIFANGIPRSPHVRHRLRQARRQAAVPQGPHAHHDRLPVADGVRHALHRCHHAAQQRRPGSSRRRGLRRVHHPDHGCRKELFRPDVHRSHRPVPGPGAAGPHVHEHLGRRSRHQAGQCHRQEAHCAGRPVDQRVHRRPGPVGAGPGL